MTGKKKIPTNVFLIMIIFIGLILSGYILSVVYLYPSPVLMLLGLIITFIVTLFFTIVLNFMCIDDFMSMIEIEDKGIIEHEMNHASTISSGLFGIGLSFALLFTAISSTPTIALPAILFLISFGFASIIISAIWFQAKYLPRYYYLRNLLRKK